ncbi:epoxide hydrolase [Amorphoplanes nipponensis]|uniref:Hydrolase n=1 Tax=Actinoplanes nipponensis TaxID=135950 RepID=A0A919JEC6_9ACTN|nr:epoxide hydrolase family protein [Actinoplanes nipponensis]GIE47815.1 hydrolase [Actinoplanes nipponensis]
MITPFQIRVADDMLDDLRERLRRTRWPEPATVGGWTQGVPLRELQELCEYWTDGYDWRAAEARLNRMPQFRTDIDGLGIHFVHARSPHPEATPLVLTHGWPGSIVEFAKVIGPLTDPVTNGGEPSDAFHVVCPSLPGYGFSDRPAEHGWTVERTAASWVQLMARLGYPRFVAAGHDWGTSISTSIAQRHPDRVIGIHLMPPLVAPDPATFGALTPAEQAALDDLAASGESGDGYSLEQSTRPQTIGYALVDSPAALAAWIIEKFQAWTDCGGDLSTVLTRDELLDNLMLYWLPGTGASAARLYWESFRAVQARFRTGTTDVVAAPTACSIFPRENPRPSRRWAQRRFTDIRYWGEPARGGHFAAFEQPDLFVAELRAGLRALRG